MFTYISVQQTGASTWSPTANTFPTIGENGSVTAKVTTTKLGGYYTSQATATLIAETFAAGQKQTFVPENKKIVTVVCLSHREDLWMPIFITAGQLWQKGTQNPASETCTGGDIKEDEIFTCPVAKKEALKRAQALASEDVVLITPPEDSSKETHDVILPMSAITG